MTRRNLPLKEKLDLLSIGEVRALLQRIYDRTVIEQRREISLGPCFIYTGRLSKNGYGRISIFGKEHATHLVVFQLLRYALPGDLELDHSCYETACWNLEHLVPRTHVDNCATRRYHGTHPNLNLSDL